MPNECGGVVQEGFLLEVLSSRDHRKDKAISASRGLLEKESKRYHLGKVFCFASSLTLTRLSLDCPFSSHALFGRRSFYGAAFLLRAVAFFQTRQRVLSRLFSRLSARGFLTTFSSFVFVHNLLHLLYLLYFLNSNSVFPRAPRFQPATYIYLYTDISPQYICES